LARSTSRAQSFGVKYSRRFGAVFKIDKNCSWSGPVGLGME
jgi:hypothetical protein